MHRWTTRLALSALLVFTTDAIPHPQSVWLPIGRLNHPPIRESSGIAKSHQHEGVYWTLNDSGNPPALYAIRLDGTLLSEHPVTNVKNVDWEGMFLDERGIWVGEIGNNSRKREDLKLYFLAEPDPFHDGPVLVEAAYPYHYPDQNPDAEGLIVHNGVPHIISKERERAVLYRFPSLMPGKEHVLERIGELTDARWITGASITPDGRRLVVTTYDRVWIYHSEDAPTLVDLIRTRPWTLAHTFGTEAVGFVGKDLLFTSEGRPLHLLPAWWYERERLLPDISVLKPTAISRFVGSSSPQSVYHERYRDIGVNISGEHILAESEGEGCGLTFSVTVPRLDRYHLTLVATRGPDYGPIEVTVDGAPVGTFDMTDVEVLPCDVVKTESVALAPGYHTVVLSTVGRRIGLDSYQIAASTPFAPEFLILGPFDKTEPNSIDTPYAPELNLDLDADVTLSNGRVLTWTPLASDPNGRLEFWRMFSVEDGTRAVATYAYTNVWSDNDRNALMLVGSDDQMAVWLNGEEVHRNNIVRNAAPDQDLASCRLNAGWNSVLCKVGQHQGGWALFLRFTDPAGTSRYVTRLE